MKNGIAFIMIFGLATSAFSATENMSLTEINNVTNQNLDFLSPLPSKIVVGETYRQRFRISLPTPSLGRRHFCGYQWALPPGISMIPVDRNCPWVKNPGEPAYFNPGYPMPFPFGTACLFDAVLNTDHVGQQITGTISLVPLVVSNFIFCDKIERHIDSPPFFVVAKPHPISMNAVPIQSGMANSNFYLNLAPYVSYYHENVIGSIIPIGQLAPQSLGGLSFDQNDFAIKGIPNQPGHYQFYFSARTPQVEDIPANNTDAVKIDIEIVTNPKDKPVFKANASLGSTAPGENYQFNLLNLLEYQPSFMSSNQIQFRIDENQSFPDWLSIDSNNRTVLKGTVRPESAGKTLPITLIASSNSGGDSEPITFAIQVNFDATKQPILKPIEMKAYAGQYFSIDLRQHVMDPSNDSSLQLLLDQVEPMASWLHISNTDPLVLEGVVSPLATGETFNVTMRASNSLGGPSKSATSQLHIEIDKNQTPFFKSGSPSIPVLHYGQAFSYDFVANQDIYPDYEIVPYSIEFAQECNNPSWLHLENNILFSDAVPDNLSSIQTFCLRISNKPGGHSSVQKLSLIVMR